MSWRVARGAALSGALSWPLIATGAEPAGATSDNAFGSALHLADWLVVAVYAAAVLGIGWHASRRRASSVEYFLGDRRFGSFTIGISMFVTLFSTISYLSGPGEIIRHGPGIYFGMVLAAPLSMILLTRWLVPALMRRRVVSLYELFEERLGLGIRLLGACMFIAYRTIWMGVLMYFGSVALSVILGVDDRPAAVQLITIAAGAVAVIYTAMGGLRAVMIVDVLQFFVLFIGALATVAVVTAHFGGLSWFPSEWLPRWRAQPFFDLDPSVRVTWVTAAILAVMLDTAHGVDQTQVQRYMAAADLQQARRAVTIRVWGSIAVWTLLVTLGLALMAFYQSAGAALPDGQTLEGFADKTFPYFIAHELPIGLSGLVVAAILSGMSSIDSGVSAITAVVMNDFVERRGHKFSSEVVRERMAKFLTVGTGAMVIGMSLLIGLAPRSWNFYEIAARTFRLFIPLELGLVILALFIRRSTPFGVVWGIIYGLVLGIVISYWTVFTGRTGISFTLYVASMLGIQLVVARMVSLLPTRDASTRRRAMYSVALLVALGAIVFVALWLGGAFAPILAEAAGGLA